MHPWFQKFFVLIDYKRFFFRAFQKNNRVPMPFKKLSKTDAKHVITHKREVASEVIKNTGRTPIQPVYGGSLDSVGDRPSVYSGIRPPKTEKPPIYTFGLDQRRQNEVQDVRLNTVNFNPGRLHNGAVLSREFLGRSTTKQWDRVTPDSRMTRRHFENETPGVTGSGVSKPAQLTGKTTTSRSTLSVPIDSAPPSRRYYSLSTKAQVPDSKFADVPDEFRTTRSGLATHAQSIDEHDSRRNEVPLSNSANVTHSTGAQAGEATGGSDCTKGLINASNYSIVSHTVVHDADFKCDSATAPEPVHSSGPETGMSFGEYVSLQKALDEMPKAPGASTMTAMATGTQALKVDASAYLDFVRDMHNPQQALQGEPVLVPDASGGMHMTSSTGISSGQLQGEPVLIPDASGGMHMTSSTGISSGQLQGASTLVPDNADELSGNETHKATGAVSSAARFTPDHSSELQSTETHMSGGVVASLATMLSDAAKGISFLRAGMTSAVLPFINSTPGRTDHLQHPDAPEMSSAQVGVLAPVCVKPEKQALCVPVMNEVTHVSSSTAHGQQQQTDNEDNNEYMSHGQAAREGMSFMEFQKADKEVRSGYLAPAMKPDIAMGFGQIRQSQRTQLEGDIGALHVDRNVNVNQPRHAINLQ
jgi:hypothetical protein